MKKREEIEIAERYFDRNPLILTVSVLISVGLVGTVWYTFMYQEFEMHWLGLVLAPAAMYAGFQTLLLILTPYALIYKDRMEIKKNLFYNKFWYFNDIKKVSEVDKLTFKITYNDDEEELLSLKGIKSSHLQDLRNELHKHVYETLVQRDLLG